MRADYVYHTGASEVKIPASMGQPRPDQMQGSPLDQLGELSCRICYDSLGIGRSSEELHKHVRDVINLSVYEHLTTTVFIPDPDPLYALALLNRPNLYVRIVPDGYEISANLRHVFEWDQYTQANRDGLKSRSSKLAATLESAFNQLAPMANPLIRRNSNFDKIFWSFVPKHLLFPEQKFLSVRLYGSRGFTHEMVRHRMAAMSQRSTRYTDELLATSDTPSETNEEAVQAVLLAEKEARGKCVGEYVWHPLIEQYLEDDSQDADAREFLSLYLMNAAQTGRVAYVDAVGKLQSYCVQKGLDKTSARKQARGAARGALGNALSTEMIYTASYRVWKDIIFNQRATDGADAEIRLVMNDVINIAHSVDPSYFQSPESLVSAKDGLGLVLPK